MVEIEWKAENGLAIQCVLYKEFDVYPVPRLRNRI
jgi:hypothetical protein